jgi:hypothetical protein
VWIVDAAQVPSASRQVRFGNLLEQHVKFQLAQLAGGAGHAAVCGLDNLRPQDRRDRIPPSYLARVDSVHKF